MPNANRIDTTLSATGSTETITMKSGVANIIASGSFGSGTLTFYARALGHTSGSFNATVSGGIMTAPGALQLNIQPCELKATLTGATSPQIELTVE